MNVEDLADKLRQMRTAGKKTSGDVDAMTRLFGVVFCEEIGNNGPAIVAEYRKKQQTHETIFGSAEADETWPGSPNSTVIQDGRKLAQFVDPHYAVVQKWKG